MSWRLAPSLNDLSSEVQRKWPGHDHSRDGAIGDAAHQRVPSGHNPDSRGVVHAIDVDINGIDPDELVRAVIRDGKRRLRVWYVIYNRRIYSRTYGWVANYYGGSDPHTGHVHIELIDELNPRYSMRQIEAAENNRAGWGLAGGSSGGGAKRHRPRSYLMRKGDTLSGVASKLGLDGWHELAKLNGISHPNRVPAGLRLAIPGRPKPVLGLNLARAAVVKGRKAAPETWELLNEWLPGDGGNLKLRYSREQQAQGYKGTRPGQDADGVPGITSLRKLASEHGWRVTAHK